MTDSTPLRGQALIEELASKLHDVYIEEAKRQGDVRHKEAYADLPENIKEYDRVLARYILSRESSTAQATREKVMQELAQKELAREEYTSKWLEERDRETAQACYAAAASVKLSDGIVSLPVHWQEAILALGDSGEWLAHHDAAVFHDTLDDLKHDGSESVVGGKEPVRIFSESALLAEKKACYEKAAQLVGNFKMAPGDKWSEFIDALLHRLETDIRALSAAPSSLSASREAMERREDSVHLVRKIVDLWSKSEKWDETIPAGWLDAAMERREARRVRATGAVKRNLGNTSRFVRITRKARP
jgi:hypothetical protein